jgi:hypothetical protein
MFVLILTLMYAAKLGDNSLLDQDLGTKQPMREENLTAGFNANPRIVKGSPDFAKCGS